MTRAVSFTVVGIAQPKGSTKAFIPKGWTRPVITSDNPRSKGWQQLVAEQAQQVASGPLFTGPVALEVTFFLPRPPSLPKGVRHHLKKPDLDKLVRCTKDALKGVLYRDDSQVVDVDAHKRYALEAAAPCAQITVREAAPPAAASMELFDRDGSTAIAPADRQEKLPARIPDVRR